MNSGQCSRCRMAPCVGRWLSDEVDRSIELSIVHRNGKLYIIIF
jgi:hypothetical protein